MGSVALLGIAGAGDDPLTIKAEFHDKDGHRMAAQRSELRAGRDIPHFDNCFVLPVAACEAGAAGIE